MLKTAFFLSLLGICTTGCINEVPLSEFSSFIADASNGLIKSERRGPLRYTAEYKPSDWMAVNSLTKGEFSKGNFMDAKRAYSDLEFFQIKISSLLHPDFLKTDLGNGYGYFTKAAYYTSMAQSDIWLIDGQDSLPCVNYHFERTYGITPYCTILIGFEKPTSTAGNPKILFEDQASNAGILEFKFKRSDLKKIPQISFSDEQE